MNPGDTIYNSMLVQAGVVSDEQIAKIQTNTMRVQARAHGLNIANVKKVYQEPVDKTLRSVRQVVKDNLPPALTQADPAGYAPDALFSLYSAETV